METPILEKKCQFCAEEILIQAEVCKFCHRDQIDDKKTEEMINSLSISKGLFIYILILLVTFSIRWWLGVIFIIALIIGVRGIQDDLRNGSKLELLEKYEKYQKYLRGKVYLDILFFIVLIIVIVVMAGQYS